MNKFPSIESFKTTVKRTRDDADYHGTTIGQKHFTGYVKLHGTNAGVHIDGDAVHAQGRNRELSIESDNYGFAVFVHS